MDPMVKAAIWIYLGLCLHAIIGNLAGNKATSSLHGLYIKHGLEAVARSIDRLASAQDRQKQP